MTPPPSIRHFFVFSPPKDKHLHPYYEVYNLSRPEVSLAPAAHDPRPPAASRACWDRITLGKVGWQSGLEYPMTFGSVQ